MKIKAQRLMAIKHLISSRKISSQEELVSLLEEEGFKLTQATLSRDLKYLKVAKVPDVETGYKYVIPEVSQKAENPFPVNEEFPVSGVESIEFSGHMAIIKTRPGFANGIASVIDSHGPYEILGTIAGDDTILLISREGVSKTDVINALSLFMPGLKEKTL
ncbi:arginine repressor [Carboxylicivirga linearis]|uniref:Arginine repressor n=1 Tax=Carboxylicivirga linearis TaxID=1628157 RepID=A0ABS5JPZ0_9BACT|nr:ArgR family transcriptional regulator [Carboxylicivirga linearis]MBS2096951.1 ArgR family transcriptional regulator [Carboxylicivirga linearis]